MIRVLVVDDDFMVAKVHGAFVGRTPGFEVAGVAHTWTSTCPTCWASRCSAGSASGNPTSTCW